MARIDPNIMFSRRPFDPFGSFGQGQQRGLAMASQRQQMEQDEFDYLRKIREQNALMSLADVYEGDDPMIQQALGASPEIAKELIRQRIAESIRKRKEYQPDNEWVDDPTDPDYQVYMQVKRGPDGVPVSTPIPGMRRHKSYKDRLAFSKEELEYKKAQDEVERAFKEKKFDADQILANKELGIAYAKLRNEDMKARLTQAKFDWEQQQAAAGAEVDYTEAKRKAVDAIDTIDRMIGNEARGIPQHKGFESSVGLKGGALLFGLRKEPTAGSEAANFMALYNKVTGQAFMTAFEGLKGGGQITEVEGQKATQALIEMNTATDEKTFIEAARRFQRYVREGMENAEKEKRMKTPKSLQTPQTQTTPGGYKIKVKQ